MGFNFIIMKEKWEFIEGTDNAYEVSNKGRIRSYYNGSQWGLKEEPELLSPVKVGKESERVTDNYYLGVTLKGRGRVLVHRIVAEAFIKNPLNKKIVNHKNGIKNDNRADNLEWVTNMENRIHMQRVLFKKGFNTTSTQKLSYNDVIDIRNTYRIGCFTVKEIADAWNISASQAGRIIRRKSWVHI